MTKQGYVIIADYSEEQPLSFEELCALCHVSQDLLQAFIEYEIIELPDGIETHQFTTNELQRIKKALRLHQQLEINLQGTAMVLELLDEIEKLRNELELVQKHYRL